MQEVQQQMAHQKQALASKLAELHAQNVELRQKFRLPITST